MLSNCSRFAPRVITRSSALRAEVSTASVFLAPHRFLLCLSVSAIAGDTCSSRINLKSAVPFAREGNLSGFPYRDNGYIIRAPLGPIIFL